MGGSQRYPLIQDERVASAAGAPNGHRGFPAMPHRGCIRPCHTGDGPRAISRPAQAACVPHARVAIVPSSTFCRDSSVSCMTPSPVPVPDAAANVPWWWVPALTGFMTLLGVLLAAFLAMWANYYIKRKELEREDRRQWDNEILRLFVMLDEIAESHSRFEWRLTELQDGSVYKRLVAYRPTIRDAGSRLGLIASPAVGEAAQDLRAACADVVQRAHDHLVPTPETSYLLDDARTRFREAVQKELRIRTDFPAGLRSPIRVSRRARSTRP